MIKRTLDFIIALVLLVLFAPLMLVIALLVGLTMGAPIIFSQVRVGHNGTPFCCYKFRTMINDAEKSLSQHIASDPEVAREWTQAQKLRRDPRVTALGYFLRKASLDELPQLFNVLRGDMSCVGPRPIVLEELQRYGADAALYLKTRPGLTGIWQVSGRSLLSYPDRIALDTFYVRNWSIFVDLAILLKTTPAVVKFNEVA